MLCIRTTTLVNNYIFWHPSKREGSAIAIQADLSTKFVETSRRLVAAVVDKFGKLDLLVNSSAIFFPTPIAETTEKQWDQLMDLNTKAPYFMIQVLFNS